MAGYVLDTKPALSPPFRNTAHSICTLEIFMKLSFFFCCAITNVIKVTKHETVIL